MIYFNRGEMPERRGWRLMTRTIFDTGRGNYSNNRATKPCTCVIRSVIFYVATLPSPPQTRRRYLNKILIFTVKKKSSYGGSKRACRIIGHRIPADKTF